MTALVVVGEDAPLWLAATVLRAALAPAGASVTAVALPSRVGPSHMHVTQPALEALHNRLGIAEANLLRATRGSFSLGQKFVDPAGATPSFFHPYGTHGTAIEGQPFLRFWFKARRDGLDAGIDDFSLNAVAAQHGRMLLPDAETGQFGRTDYGYHLPAAAYARSLKALARQDGVDIREATAVDAVRDAAGTISALRLDDGTEIAGDFFVDASRGAVLGSDAVWEDWRDVFPGDRVLQARGPRMRSVPACGQVIAAEWGWVGLYPSQQETHLAAVFSAAAEQSVFDSLPSLCGFVPAEATLSDLEPGRRAIAWEANCVAIGPAAARFDPIHGVDLLGVQLGLVHLLARFPVSMHFEAERRDYNATIAALGDRVRDFQAAHYRLARHAGGFWDAARGGARPPELAHKIATFAARGELAMLEDESFPPDSWHALFLGHGLVPESWPPAADRVSAEQLRAAFRRMFGFIKDKVLAQPPHEECFAGPHRMPSR